jgi:hypothetical protein
MVWNRDLPGIAGDLKLSFEQRVNLETGAGFRTAQDPIHPDWDTHFAINSTRQQKVVGGESRYTMIGDLWSVRELVEACAQVGFSDVQVWRHTYDSTKSAAGVFLGCVEPESLLTIERWTAYIAACR